MIKIQEKNSGEQKILSINVWSNEPDKDLYEVIQIADFVLLYEKSRFITGKIKCLGVVEKSEAQLHLKYNKTDRFFFEPVPYLQGSYTKINVLVDLHYYFGVGLTVISGATPGRKADSISITGLSKDETWFVLKVLNEKKLITLSDLACLTQAGRKYLKDYFFDRQIDPKNIPSKTQKISQIIKADEGIVPVKIFKWVSKKADAIIIGVIVTVVGGLLLVCIIHYFGGKGFMLSEPPKKS